MNRKQRDKNRGTAIDLYFKNKDRRLAKHICENCGQPGGHWVALPQSLEDILNRKEPSGFWTCNSETES